MKNEEFSDYFRKLDWNQPRDVQLKAIDEIKSLCNLDYSLLLQPLDKRFWENSAIILCSLDRELLDKHIISGLFDWLQDLNWPGANIIFEYLKPLMGDPNIHNIWRKKMNQATKEQDDDWLSNLEMLA